MRYRIGGKKGVRTNEGGNKRGRGEEGEGGNKP